MSSPAASLPVRREIEAPTPRGRVIGLIALVSVVALAIFAVLFMTGVFTPGVQPHLASYFAAALCVIALPSVIISGLTLCREPHDPRFAEAT